jgi:hypothetical protein
MLKKLADKLSWPIWAQKSERYVRLTVLDRLLDGTFYDDLPNAFYDELQDGQYVPLEQRRPSVQVNLPKFIAKTTARKLFAGNHVPKLYHPDEEVQARIKALADGSNLFYYMLQAAIWASVGSVAATFKIVDDKFLIEIWRSRFCWPQFSADGQLDYLRIAYLTRDWALVSHDVNGDPIDSGKSYWFVRDLDATAEYSYKPIPEREWNPIDGAESKLKLRRENGKLIGKVAHRLGFVPACWCVNLAGGEVPDGDSTFSACINMSIELDYTMSQIGRGVRYNSAPELVIKGDLKGGADKDGRVVRSPVTVLQFKAGMKDSTGMTFEGGDAKLLEMTGAGVEAGLKYVGTLRKLALETVAAARKDPEQRSKGPVSGKAMENLDDQFIDLVQELRSSIGDTFMLTLLKKMILAGITVRHPLFRGLQLESVSQIGAIWKRALPTPPEALVQVSSALHQFFVDGFLEQDEAKIFVRSTLDLDALEAQTAISGTTSGEPAPEPTPNEQSGPGVKNLTAEQPSAGSLGSVSLDPAPRRRKRR